MLALPQLGQDLLRRTTTSDTGKGPLQLLGVDELTVPPLHLLVARVAVQMELAGLVHLLLLLPVALLDHPDRQDRVPNLLLAPEPLWQLRQLSYTARRGFLPPRSTLRCVLTLLSELSELLLTLRPGVLPLPLLPEILPLPLRQLTARAQVLPPRLALLPELLLLLPLPLVHLLSFPCCLFVHRIQDILLPSDGVEPVLIPFLVS